jgi:hypothetical protein
MQLRKLTPIAQSLVLSVLSLAGIIREERRDDAAGDDEDID